MYIFTEIAYSMNKFLPLVFFLAILLSCRQSEFEFSCDPVINAYVLENKEELSKVPVTEFADFDLLLQKAVYNSWDAQKKRDVWFGKIKLVLLPVLFRRRSALIFKS